MTEEISDNKEVEVKRYMLSQPKNVDKIKKQMLDDSNKLSNSQRFGFFSIIHANTIGDESYSIKKKIEKDANGKIKVSPRGIYTKATKKGKFIDSYFDSSFLREDKKIRDRLSEIAKLNREESLIKVRRSKDKAENFVKSFKPSGPQGYKDIFYPDKLEYKVPIHKESSLQKNIDFKKRTVNTDKRGILTQPLKSGTAFSLGGVVFSYHKTSKQEVEMFKKMTEKEKEEDLARKRSMQKKEKGDFKTPFVPNSINKNDTFQTDKALYGLDEAEYSRLIKDYEEHQKKVKVGEKIVKHDKSFFPASLNKSVSLIRIFKFTLG